MTCPNHISASRLRLAFPLLLFALLFVMTMSGCSLLPSSSTEQQAALDQLQHFEVRGKLSIQTDNDGVTGFLSWEQNHQDYDLFVTGPLGQGSTRLQGNSRQATLTSPEHDQPLTADSAEQLMTEQLGWYIPVEGIRYWVKGQPSPASEAEIVYDDFGLLSNLQQDGWTISFKRYQQQQGQWLPGLIKLKGYNYRLTLAINNWTLYD